ncbi:hypothetical protein ACJX0J_019600, partial [Zea mays]
RKKQGPLLSDIAIVVFSISIFFFCGLLNLDFHLYEELSDKLGALKQTAIH